jgi:outer membrane protein assembly factor BamE (lipoprotein component of BamABCDE complex)
MIALCCAVIERLIKGFEDSVYAVGYSEPDFLSLKNGMTKPQVQAIMGDPKAKNSWIDGGEVELWMYSISPSDGNFWRRWVFFRNGRIYWIDCRFYVD